MVENIEKEVEVVSYPQSVLINDTMLCRECSVVLDPGEADTYLWNTGSTGRYLNVSEPGLYSVQMKNNECMVEDSALIGRYHDVVGVPSAFTPNNDGLNDRFEVITTGKLYNYKMQIYNRYGMLVFVSENPEEGWDGTYNEKPCPKASYFWYLNYDSFQENGLLSHKLKKGFVTIIR
jgi:gliding motility-associated-like protein